MSDQKLHVIIPYFNHTNARVSRRNLELCLRHLSITPDCRVVLVEGIWNREAELPDWSGRIFRHLKFDLQSPIWVKENLINLGIKSLGEEWEYAAWIDKDIQFLNPAWAQETVLKLEQCDLLQPWSRLLLLDEFYEVLDDYENVTGSGFGMLHETKDIKGGKSFCQKRDEGGVGGFPGYSWAINKSCFKKTGGFFDLCIVGGGDAIIPLYFDKSSYREYMILLKGLLEDTWLHFLESSWVQCLAQSFITIMDRLDNVSIERDIRFITNAISIRSLIFPMLITGRWF
jgi:hypothetical protein